MKPDWTYIDGEDDIEQFITGAISELGTLCPLESLVANDGNFEQLPIMKFALEMLLQEIRHRRDESPYDIVGEFTQRMYDYSYESRTPDVSYIFDVMYNAANTVLKEVSQ